MIENSNIGVNYIKERMEKARELLKKKYCMKFDVLDYLGQSSMKEYYEVSAVSSEHPDMVFDAAINIDYSGFSDSYAEKMVSKRFSDIVAKNLDAVKGYVYIYSEPLIRHITLTSADIPAGDLADVPGGSIMTVRVFMCIEEKSAEKIYVSYMKMFDSLEKNSGNLYVYITSEEMLRDVQKYVESNITLYHDFFEMVRDNLVITDRYENGVPQITKKSFIEKMGKCL